MEKNENKSKIDKLSEETPDDKASKKVIKPAAKKTKSAKSEEEEEITKLPDIENPKVKKNPSDVEVVDTEEINDYYNLVEFNWESTTYNTTVSRKYAQKKKYEMPNHKLIRAFIPGIIQKIFVSDGAKVKQNEVLLVLEAMKMKNNLLAPFNGIVKKVYVKQGAQVTKNEILVELK